MAFYASSSNVRLGDGGVLLATCNTKFGGQVDAQFDLNAVLGNIDGGFVWGLTAFVNSAENIRLERAVLHARLRDCSGNWKDAQFDLDGMLTNNNGKLEAVNVPGILAVPDNVVPEVVKQFSQALDQNPGWKVQIVDEPDGSTLWYVNAQAENKTDTFFKTYNADARASFMHTVQSKGRPVEQVSADVFSAYAGASVEYIQIGEYKFGTYAGAGAELNLFKADASVFDLKLGVGVETGAGIRNGSLDAHVAGCGVTIGKRMSISVFGNEIGIDFGKFFA